jgi:hypothetical protein
MGVVDAADVELWFAAYLDCFVALGRGERDDVEALLEFYDVPMLLSAPGGTAWLLDADQVTGVMRAQVEGLRHAGFHRTDVEDAQTVVLNEGCARHEGRFTRRAADGTVIATFTASYVLATGPSGPRIAVLALHG